MFRRELFGPACLALLCVAVHVTPTRSAVAAQAPVTWLIFVDDLHLDFRNTGRLRDALRTMVSELVREGDRFAIASSGPSSLAVAMTSDRQVLIPAMRVATGNALKPQHIMQSASSSAEVFYRASTAVSVARSMLTDLPSDAGGPTAMLYVSNGYSFDLLPDPAPGAAQLVRGRTFTRAQVHDELRELTSTAMRTGVRIFAIDRRTAIAAIDDSALVDPWWSAHATEMRRVLRTIAEDSGGFAIVDGDFVTQLKRVASALGR